MPYRSIGALKKLASLGGEIVVLAPYEPASVMAAFANDPVKLGMIPFGGGDVRTQGIALDEVSQGALIDQRVAVVKSGDELWALLDVQHKPKIDPVTRSIRALAHNPRGGSALGLSWDGSGVELKLEGAEVVVRSFELRGKLRAVWLDGMSCHVVADGEGQGGRYRQHPGATPEAGTQIRCDLPLPSAKMSECAGGPQLLALYAKGKSEICVVRKVGAAALEAKVLGMGQGVRSVAVLETSMFVLGEDGVVRLYDGGTLERARDGAQTAALFELSLSAYGAPSLLASTTRGGNRLWIGTKDGEVLRADAVKGTSLL